MDKLINRIPGSRLLISSLPGSALRTHVESLGKPRDVNKRSQSLYRSQLLNHFRPVTMTVSTTPETLNPRIGAQTVANYLPEIGERSCFICGVSFLA